LSFQLHNAAFQDFSYNAVYVPFLTEKPQEFLHGILSSGSNIQGLNITTPYKSAHLDINADIDTSYLVLSEEVKKTGSMNTLIYKQDHWLAKNSDIEGFIASVSSIDFNNRDILVLGAGGVAKSIIYALRTRLCPTNKNIYIYNRTKPKAKSLADIYELHTLSSLQYWPHHKSAIVINCTSMGQGTQKNILSFCDSRSFDSSHIVIDLVYTMTPLLQKAKNDGAKYYGGLSMLIWQAAISFSWWTGKDISVCESSMRKSLSSDLFLFSSET
jgi:shikimate dehydrogenase